MGFRKSASTLLLFLGLVCQSWAQAPIPALDYAARLSALESEIAILREENGNIPVSASSDVPQFTDNLLCRNIAKAPVGQGPTLNFSGFFHLDSVWFNQDQTNLNTVGDLQDGVDFRRSRIGVKGNVTESVSYMMEYDFAASQALFTDVWVTFAEVPMLGNVRLGRWRQPFGMSVLTSAREMPFLERPMTQPLAPFRQTGIGFFDHNTAENLTWAASVFRYPSDNFGDNVGDNGGYGFAGRVTGLALDDPSTERLIHLGSGYYYADPSRNQTRFASPPEIQVVDSLGGVLPAPSIAVPPFVDTGLVPTDSVQAYNVELAGAWGPIVIQSEAYWLQLNQLGGPTETIEAAYVHFRYLLTGERVPYNRHAAIFGRVVPSRDANIYCGDWGAWEIAARWSYANFNGDWLAIPPEAPGPGRRANAATLGTNWYLNRHTKFQFNYIHAFLDSPITGDSGADILAFRCQLDF